MNAINITARDLADALLGRPLARQTVHVCSTEYGHRSAFGIRTRYIVLVTPHGSEQGEYYEVSTKRALDDLRFYTPDEMGLDPLDPADIEHDDATGIPSPAELLREHMGRVL